MFYCHAVMPKAGLGNRLMPWARARVYAKLHNLPMLAPRWAQLKIGPLLRGESDLRLYHNLFQAHPEYINGVKAAYLLGRAEKLAEPENLQTRLPEDKSDKVIIFSDERDHFRQLNGWHDLLAQDLRAITRPKWLKNVADVGEIPIGLHVRRGDFSTPANADELRHTGHLRVPLEWFIQTIGIIREAIGVKVRAVVTSDGIAEELRDLLNLENVTRAETGSAIGDLLVLSQARVLLASGSSFSAWASFLGQMPTVTHPGQSILWFQMQPAPGVFVGEFDPASPPPDFIANARARLGSNHPPS